MAKKQEKAIRNYLTSLRDPAALRDDKAIADAQTKLDTADDSIERLKLRQHLIELQQPSLNGVEAAFVEHAKPWADKVGISGEAFIAEGVPATVLRRAGFRVTTTRTARGGRRATTRTRRTRVSADQVRNAIPSGVFTVSDLQQRSGASAAVVRRIIHEEIDAGRLTDHGASPSHTGPGRAPRTYRRG
jgi:hypothetical protein